MRSGRRKGRSLKPLDILTSRKRNISDSSHETNIEKGMSISCVSKSSVKEKKRHADELLSESSIARNANLWLPESQRRSKGVLECRNEKTRRSIILQAIYKDEDEMKNVQSTSVSRGFFDGVKSYKVWCI